MIDAHILPEDYLTADQVKRVRAGDKQAISDAKKSRSRMRDSVVICLLKMRNNFTNSFLELVTGWGKHKLSRVLNKWIPLIGENARLLCNLQLDKNWFETNQSKEFQNSPLKSVGLIGDGKDMRTYEFRELSGLRRGQYSNKYKSSCIRGLSFTSTKGLYVNVSELYLARASESKLFAKLAKRFEFLDSSIDILYNKGLRNCRWVLPNLNKLLTPHCLNGIDQYHGSELEENRTLARLRYTVEVGCSRVENWKLLSGKITYFNLRYANATWLYAHCHSNLMNPLRD